MGLLGRLLAALSRRAGPILAGGIVVGLVLPDLATLLRPWLQGVIFFMTTAMLLRIDWAAVLRYLRRPGLVALATLWVLLVTPLLAALVARLLDLSPGLTAAVVLHAAGPPITTATVFALILGLDAAFALVVSTVATLLVPLTAPLVLSHLAGVPIAISATEMLLRLLVFVGGGMVLALVIRRAAGTVRLERWSPQIGGATVLLLLWFAIAIMEGAQAALLRDPALAVIILIAGFAANLGLNLVASALAWQPLGRRVALTLGLLTGSRNLGLLWAALGDAVPFEVTLYVAFGQFPIFMLPALIMRPVRWLITPGPATPDATGPRASH